MRAPLLDEGSCADLLDELLPSRLEWRRLADRYPRAAPTAAAAVGFWLGRRRGIGLLAALAAYAAAQVAGALEPADD